jgi:hypothetical protein
MTTVCNASFSDAARANDQLYDVMNLWSDAEARAHRLEQAIKCFQYNPQMDMIYLDKKEAESIGIIVKDGQIIITY